MTPDYRALELKEFSTRTGIRRPEATGSVKIDKQAYDKNKNLRVFLLLFK
jgi:hypothetical protein